MSVKLTKVTPLILISDAIRYSHYTFDKSDSYTALIRKDKNGTCRYCGVELEVKNDKDLYCPSCGRFFDKEYHIGKADFDLIKRIGFHMNHSSVLEHSLLVFDVKMSTKALLEESRHRIGLSQTVTSSRYALDKIYIEFEESPSPRVQESLNKIKEIVVSCLNAGEPLDEVAMLLPQAFIYELRLTFNLRSLLHFLDLRLAKSAHRTIRKIAVELLDTLPLAYRELVLENESIKKKYFANYNNEFRKENI